MPPLATEIPSGELAYTVVLTEHEYATLLRLVMLHGTGTSHNGVSTPITLREKLATPSVSTAGR